MTDDDSLAARLQRGLPDTTHEQCEGALRLLAYLMTVRADAERLRSLGPLDPAVLRMLRTMLDNIAGELDAIERRPRARSRRRRRRARWDA